MKVLDLFSGIGGFSLGLERAGMETVAFCEVDKHAQKVLKNHWPKVPIFEDVRDLSFLDFEEGEIDLICGGFPCQDISVAGPKKGLAGKRSGLWFEYWRLINEIRPKYVIIENVANLRNLGLARVLKDLRAIGYNAEWHIISACSIGAPHRRERIWIIAYSMFSGLQGHGGHGGPGEARKTRMEGEARSGAMRPLKKGFVTYPDDIRLGPASSPAQEKQEWRSKTAARFRPLFRQIFSVEPAICRGNDGFPRGVDGPRKQQIKQLGNAVVPQIPQTIGEAILEYEKKNTSRH